MSSELLVIGELANLILVIGELRWVYTPSTAQRNTFVKICVSFWPPHEWVDSDAASEISDISITGWDDINVWYACASFL